MGIILGVAGVTIGGRIGEPVVGMTALAGDVNMCTGEREGRLGMVESRRNPTIRGVTSAALSAQLASVGIVLGMAGITIGGCVGELVIEMAALASDFYVSAGEGEG